jgi:hypothetical protein
MKLVAIVILASFFFITVNVNAIDVVNKGDYQQDILNTINGYGEKFDDCFTTLPADFPDVSTEYLELNERIGQLATRLWYHRVLETSSYDQVLHEAFFYENYGNTQDAISI